MQQFIDKDTHSGNPQDEFNKVQSGYPYSQLRDEANYILEQQEDGSYKFTKKPEDCELEQVNEPWDFLRSGAEKVLVVTNEGRYHRYNFDYRSQFPKQDDPEVNADGSEPSEEPSEDDGGEGGTPPVIPESDD